jgi:hypothetical protein
MNPEVEMIKYFWQDKGDLERFTGWEEIKPKYPEVAKAWDDYKISMKILDCVVKCLGDD